ncbi:MAG: hypothetical protein KKH91_08145 [Elusimicrobia bacterium]|nr:hypothetical protein [Elusimicrobiota bacterium]
MLNGFRCPDGRNVSVVECLSNKACSRKCLPTVFRIGILLKNQYRDPNTFSTSD